MSIFAVVRYRIEAIDPAAHLFRVTCVVAQPDEAGQTVSLPAWIPGSYMIRDFAKNVVWLRARCGEHAVAVEKLDKQTWRCAPAAGPLTIEYEVYAWDLSVRSAHLDTSHAYFNASSVCLRVHGLDGQPCEVELCRPLGEAYSEWRVATALRPKTALAYAFGIYEADDYDELIDHPVEMGNFSLASFEVAGVPHDIAITGRHRADLARLCADLEQICTYEVALFGELPPMRRYLFLIMAVGEGYGGLEHRASCSLLCSRNCLPRADDAAVSDEYRDFLALCSHEYFHTWNVKRIKPAAFLPYDLRSETYTRQLWAFEGITSYYDELNLVRSGRITRESYLEMLGQAMTRVQRGSGRLKQSLADSSFDAWTKFYKQDENSPNAVVSYYAKGGLVALALDLTIRQATDGRRSLDDVMRELWLRYGKPGIGVPEDGVERVAAEIAGIDLRGFFDQALRDTADLDLAPLLEHVGIALRRRAAQSARDKGGKAGEGENRKPLLVLGVRLVANGNDGAQLSHVLDGGAAQAAGLAAGDTIIAIDNIRVNAKNLEQTLQTFSVNQYVRVHAFRRDELRDYDVQLRPAPLDTIYLSTLEAADESLRQRRDAWFGDGREAVGRSL